ncbi:MAG: hypothetical protein HRF51_07545 [bacterium]
MLIQKGARHINAVAVDPGVDRNHFVKRWFWIPGQARKGEFRQEVRRGEPRSAGAGFIPAQ